MLILHSNERAASCTIAAALTVQRGKYFTGLRETEKHCQPRIIIKIDSLVKGDMLAD